MKANLRKAVDSSSKRVLLHYPVFNVGGAERSVLKLINGLLERNWHVHLVLTTAGGSLEPEIPDQVRVTRLRPWQAGSKFKFARGLLQKISVLPDLFLYLVALGVEYFNRIAFLRHRFDAAIVCLGGLPAEFCVRWVNANTRIQWIRNDLAHSDPNGKVAGNIKRNSHKIDYYVCVSQTCKESLIIQFPYLDEKAVTIYNLLQADEMLRKAEDPIESSFVGPSVPIVVTVCRIFDKAKALYRMVDVHRELLNEGYDFAWLVIGDGPDRQSLQDYIDNHALGKRMTLLGQKKNPFPYIKQSDICAVLSYYEGFCGSVIEAKVMGKPVIATLFSGIKEQLRDGETGLIVENEKNAIVTGFRSLLGNKALCQKMTNSKLPMKVLNDEEKMNQLEALIFPSRGQLK